MKFVAEIVTYKLGYHKFWARWILKISTETLKNQRMESYEKDGDTS